MQTYPVLFMTWLVAGAGALLGSILGNAAGRRGLIVGAIVGGVVGVVVGVGVAARLRWLGPSERRGGMWGGVIGFLVASPIAVTNLDTPITPLMSCALVGVGVLIGAGVTRAP